VSSPCLDLDGVAIVVAREGRLPAGADTAVAEAGGAGIVVGSGAEEGAQALPYASRAWWAETGNGLEPARLSALLAGVIEPIPLVVLPASPDGRDLAPRLAARLGRSLLAGAIDCRCDVGADGAAAVRATVSRLDDRVLVPVEVAGSAVVTVMPVARPDPEETIPSVLPLPLPRAGDVSGAAAALDPKVVAVIEPDVRTMDLTDAPRVVAGGAGLAAGADDREAAARFGLLERVGAALDAAAGATRVATDAGWIGYERQIGTTGVAVDPDLYVAFGIAGAAQHIGGLGSPRHVISVNTDGSCPMTAMADLGVVTDAYGLLVELAGRFGVAVVTGPDAGAVGVDG
jgi:electron transfer flavoprotein alpha subunit